jgi:caa(3)-type oxidase subunit IV
VEHTHEHEHHITGPRTYGAILGALLVLTVITVWVAQFDFGAANTVVALLVASFKGALVALFFMHLRHDKFSAVIFVGGLFFLGVFLIFSLFDISTRQTVLPSNLKQPVEAFPGAPLGKPIQPGTGMPKGQAPSTPQ